MRYTFSEDVKGEICQLDISTTEEAKSEIIGYLKAKGTITKTSVEMFVKIEVGFIPSARRIMNLMNIIEIDKKKLTMIKNKLKRKRVQIFIPISVLEKLRISPMNLPEYIFNDVGLFSCFLRGVFVASGSLTDPSKSYHFEIVSYNEDLLNKLKIKINEFLGISGKVVKLNYNFRYYVKRARDIIELLYFMGAQRAADKMERIVQSREIKSDFNRSLNFLSANAKRTGESNARQIEVISEIINRFGIEVLPEELRNIALARLDNEDLSLSELGQLFDPPLTKTMVYNRLKKIFKIHKELTNNK
ncbi:DNA-binding protein WhiA [Thermosipho ferrireducens]|uniref:Probable cell division protein WhiA n=1 Tax=Thermosipho ferrireducens TaxID=2571116 RepID=A0ABX7S4H0_9BACT|nr:DNA-binding protein WhiA [Thermosipho ferrireducens]QTA37344.1 DNA-binding protein WhiA [Thermosipho ferrireducens]